MSIKLYKVLAVVGSSSVMSSTITKYSIAYDPDSAYQSVKHTLNTSLGVRLDTIFLLGENDPNPVCDSIFIMPIDIKYVISQQQLYSVQLRGVGKHYIIAKDATEALNAIRHYARKHYNNVSRSQVAMVEITQLALGDAVAISSDLAKEDIAVTLFST